jgi:hypothetical protein
MIVVQLQGGLGNQMFQYAFGRALAEARMQNFYLDVSFLNKKADGYTQRQYALDIFSSAFQIAPSEDIQAFENALKKDFISRIKRRLIPSEFVTHYERGFTFQNLPFDEKKANRYIGFFQSEKYFKSYRSIILAVFKFPIDELVQAQELREKIKSCDAISVHIRRGDYVTNQNANQFHGTCDENYYYNAVRTLCEGLNNPQLFIFSDDLDWVKLNMKFDIPSHYIDFNTGERSHFDMEMMSLCNHHIIANSSFSWWGAWLNEKANKKVIAPINWFNDTSIDTKDLIPEGWQTM